jgi:hypothetical protein
MGSQEVTAEEKQESGREGIWAFSDLQWEHWGGLEMWFPILFPFPSFFPFPSWAIGFWKAGIKNLIISN